MEELRVAIVDDHYLVRDALRRIVDRCPGFKVVLEAENGEDYEAQCEGQNAPDITLVDLHMPVRDGWLTLHWMRAHQPGTKGIAFSFALTDEAAWLAMEYGACALMMKNERAPAWHAALQAVRDEGDYLNPAMRNALRYRPAKDSPAALQERFVNGMAPGELRFLKEYVADAEPTLNELAKRWKVQPSTVETWRRRVVDKLGVSKRLALFKCALRFHVIKWESLGGTATPDGAVKPPVAGS